MGRSIHSQEDWERLGREFKDEDWREGVTAIPHRIERKLRKEKGRRIDFKVWPAILAEDFEATMSYLGKRYGNMKFEYALRRLQTPHPDEAEE